MTRRSRWMPKVSVTSWCCRRTLSWMVIRGKRRLFERRRRVARRGRQAVAEQVCQDNEILAGIQRAVCSGHKHFCIGMSPGVPAWGQGRHLIDQRSTHPASCTDNRAVGKNPPFCSMTLGTSKIAGWLIVLALLVKTATRHGCSCWRDRYSEAASYCQVHQPESRRLVRASP